MRPIRVDVETDRLINGRPEVLKGKDLLGPVVRWEGGVSGTVTRSLTTKKTNTLLFRNDSSFAMNITVRNAANDIIQTMQVASNSDLLAPLERLGTTIEYVSTDVSLAQVTALIF